MKSKYPYKDIFDDIIYSEGFEKYHYKLDVASDKSSERIQNIVDNSPEADFYYTDGYLGYIDVVYPGKHIRNVRDKKDTHNVESINADLRHYIPVLARRSRCFARKN